MHYFNKKNLELLVLNKFQVVYIQIYKILKFKNIYNNTTIWKR